MKKYKLLNIIENQKDIDKMSRNSLLKLLNLTNFYLGKNIVEIIDEIIEKYSDKNQIEISNIQINDLKSEIFKTHYKSMIDKIIYKIYMYENYDDLYFTGKELNLEILIKKLKEDIKYNKYQAIYISSRTIKSPHMINIYKESNESVIDNFMMEKIKKIKRIETLKLRFYFEIEKIEIEKKNRKTKPKYK